MQIEFRLREMLVQQCLLKLVLLVLVRVVAAVNHRKVFAIDAVLGCLA